MSAPASAAQQTDSAAEPALTVLMFTEGEAVADIYRQHLPPRWRLEHLVSRQDEDEQLERLRRADVLIHSDVPLSGELLDAAQRLRLIHRVGVGLDSLDLDAVAGRGVPVCICPVGTPEAVAEHAILLMLAAGRHLTRLHDAVTQGRWPKWEYRSRSLGLFGSVVGIVGFGRTGHAVAERLGPLLTAPGDGIEGDGIDELEGGDERDRLQLDSALPTLAHLLEQFPGNVVLRREAEMKAKFPTKTLLADLEPLLIDIANLPDHARPEEVRAIKERVDKTEIVAALIEHRDRGMNNR